MPERGMRGRDISAMMRKVAKVEDKKWADGYVSGAVYHGEADHLKLLNDACQLLSQSVSQSINRPISQAVRQAGRQAGSQSVSQSVE